MDGGHFELARLYAQDNSDKRDVITMKEADAKLIVYSHSCLWASPDTRAALWLECSKHLRKNDCGNLSAGKYFLAKAEAGEILDVAVSSLDKITLLILALKWFDGSINHSDPVRDQEFLEVGRIRSARILRLIYDDFLGP